MSPAYLGTRENLPPDLGHSRGLVRRRAAKCLLLPCGLFSAGVLLATGSPLLALLTGWVGALPLAANRSYNLRDLGREFMHVLNGQRFLCPSCLHFGDFHAARTGTEADHPRCGVCDRVFESDLYHARRVRVVGALPAGEFDQLLPPTPEPNIRDACVAGYDDSQYLHYYLDLTRLPEPAHRLPSHALNDIETVWVDPGLSPAALEAAIARAERLCGRKVSAMIAWVGPGVPSPETQAVLTRRFQSVLSGTSTFPVFPGFESGRGS